MFYTVFLLIAFSCMSLETICVYSKNKKLCTIHSILLCLLYH